MTPLINPEPTMTTFIVPDMTCGHCQATITKALKALDPAAKVEIDLLKHRVTVESGQPEGALRAAIVQAGYSPT
jgi:copper chaperone